jgi:CheY-like chemotaxis protein
MSEESILIVDSNEAFATILREALDQSGEYQTTVANNGEEALAALNAGSFDLAIVDLGLSDPDGVALARTIRHQKPDMRLMLIPIMGEDLPRAAASLKIHGILTKPFFFPELPGIVGKALGKEPEQAPAIAEEPTVPETPPVVEVAPVEEAPAVEAPVAPPPTPPAEAVEPAAAPAARIAEVLSRISEKQMQRIVKAMTSLAQDISAAAVILSCEGGLIAHAGRLSEDEAKGLAQLVGENWRTSARVARILGQEQLRFEQSIEGGEHMLYSLAVSGDIILSAALGTGVPLGMIRHSAKNTVDALGRLIE